MVDGDGRAPGNARDHGSNDSLSIRETHVRIGYRMKLNVVLVVSSIYLAIVGLGFMFAPRQIGVHARQRNSCSLFICS
jgi:hypothetical protein